MHHAWGGLVESLKKGSRAWAHNKGAPLWAPALAHKGAPLWAPALAQPGAPIWAQALAHKGAQILMLQVTSNVFSTIEAQKKDWVLSSTSKEAEFRHGSFWMGLTPSKIHRKSIFAPKGPDSADDDE